MTLKKSVGWILATTPFYLMWASQVGWLDGLLHLLVFWIFIGWLWMTARLINSDQQKTPPKRGLKTYTQRCTMDSVTSESIIYESQSIENLYKQLTCCLFSCAFNSWLVRSTLVLAESGQNFTKRLSEQCLAPDNSAQLWQCHFYLLWVVASLTRAGSVSPLRLVVDVVYTYQAGSRGETMEKSLCNVHVAEQLIQQNVN